MIATTTVRVRYKDTDCMRVAYYGNYLTWFEVGRVEYLRQAGTTIAEVDRTVHMPVVEAYVRYVRPARLDELLEIRCWVGERKRASFRFDYAIAGPDGALVATGHTLHACLDAATGKVIGVPAWLAALLTVAAEPAAPGGGGAEGGRGAPGARV
ncbi:MAG TPA: thioesterase family protein [Candidatus Binatia bacterium]|nr:thioesterase family protein [Candidatus Binatia bacterium]